MRFAAATAATQVFATLTAAGWSVPPWVLTTLEDVRDGRGSAASFKAAALRLDAEGQLHRRWVVGSLEQKYYWALAGSERVCWLASSGVDNLQDTLNQLSYALAEPALLERWYADALEAATQLPANATWCPDRRSARARGPRPAYRTWRADGEREDQKSHPAPVSQLLGRLVLVDVFIERLFSISCLVHALHVTRDRPAAQPAGDCVCGEKASARRAAQLLAPQAVDEPTDEPDGRKRDHRHHDAGEHDQR